ncbi:MAG: hypothetical protein SFW62_03720 [Alphaproteobacteria bacterium]|nr:hypothetical protein [Alphaproteobacteria bacterium]
MPELYIPFPQEQIKNACRHGPSPCRDGNIIIGESVKDPLIDSVSTNFTMSFNGRPLCETMAVSKPLMAWRVFSALHETLHYISDNVRINDMNLNEYVFTAVNRTNNETQDLYLTAQVDFLRDLLLQGRIRDDVDLFMIILEEGIPHEADDLDKFTVANATAIQIPESIADVGAALYILANYESRSDNIGYSRKIADFRTAYYVDGNHNTGPSLQAGLQAFSSYPVKNLSIVDAAIWAAEIIRRQPEFTKSIQEMADEVRDRFRAGIRIAAGDEMAQEALGANYKETPKQQKIIDEVWDARGRACVSKPLEMAGPR